MGCEENEVHHERSLPERARRWRTRLNRLEAAWRFLTEINGYVVAKEPWRIRKEEGASPRLARILYAAAEGVRLFGAMISPFVPETSRRILAAFGQPPRDAAAEDLAWGKLEPGAPMPEVPALFPRADAAAYFGEKEQTMDDKPAPTPSAAPAPPAPAAVPATAGSKTSEGAVEDREGPRGRAGAEVENLRPGGHRLLAPRRNARHEPEASSAETSSSSRT